MQSRRFSEFDAAWKRSFRRKLLAWFGKNARDLPWRRTRDPYRIWISEIMLQQTQVATVIPYYKRFLDRFPDVRALAAAPEDDVLRIWEGLGYYRRARQLHAAAQEIVSRHAGEFPQQFDSVRALSGIGRYTAGAILSIAFDARCAIVEANTTRLLSRLAAYRGDPASSGGRQLLWRSAEALLPRKRCGTFNQALMELGSLVCLPQNPNCSECPVASLCGANELGLQDQVPRAKTKARHEDVCEVAVVVRRGNRVLLRRCTAGQRWAGLWDFPRFAVESDADGQLPEKIAEKTTLLTGLTVEPGEHLTTIKHGVTRFRITLECYQAKWRAGRLRKSFGEMQWAKPSELERFALNVTARKIGRLLSGTS